MSESSERERSESSDQSTHSIIQKVAGNNNIFSGAGNVIVVNPPPIPSSEVEIRNHLHILLDKVKTFWIKGYLEKSIHNEILLDLAKEIRPDAVDHPWEEVLELPDESPQILSSSIKITNLFDQMGKTMLILGEPGSGKTITLLELARDLIRRVESDETFSQPIPVVFHLSTWGNKRQPLIDWMMTELSNKYQIPKRFSRPWIENNRLLLLLDGLDEVNVEYRVLCVEAINKFGQTFGLAGLVVCSRLEEYTKLPIRLRLNGAICLQPLTPQQVNKYLKTIGPNVDALRNVLGKDEVLLSLSQSPLMLSVMYFVYCGMSIDEIEGQYPRTLEEHRHYLFKTYIERMLKRRAKINQIYSINQTKLLLSWLAEQMSKHKQSIFLIEQLEPSWLFNKISLLIYAIISRLIITLIIYAIGLGATFEGLLLGLFIGVGCGIFEAFRLNQNITFDARRQNSTTKLIINTTLAGLMLAIASGCIGGVLFAFRYNNDKILNGENLANSILWNSPQVKEMTRIIARFRFVNFVEGEAYAGLISGVLFALRSANRNIESDIRSIELLSWSWRKVKDYGKIGAIIGLYLAIVPCLIDLSNDLIFGSLKSDKNYNVFDTLVSHLLFEPIIIAFMSVPIGFLVGGVFGGITSNLVESKTYPNQGIKLSLRNAVFAGSLFGLIIGLPISVTSNPLNGLYWGFPVSILAALWYGGIDIIYHIILRLILWFTGLVPLNYARFLDYASERILLRKVGGGYIYVHRLLLEYFVSQKIR